MCLSTVFEVSPEGKNKVCEYVSSIKTRDGEVVLTDIMGIEKVLPGSILSLDLVNNEILVGFRKE